MVKMPAALEAAGLTGTRMLLSVHDELVFEVPHGDEEQAAQVIRDVMASAAEPVVTLDVPLSVEVGWGANWGVAH
jgi:DNA polymerase-1